MSKNPDGERIITMIFGSEYDFWRGSAREELVAVAQDLSYTGMQDDDIESAISSIWRTAAGEYGG